MPRRTSALALCLLALTCGAAWSQTLPKAPRYAVTDLGTLPGGDHSGAYGINNAGQIVGWSDGKPNDVTGFDTKVFIHNHAVLWDHGKPRDLGLLKGFPFSTAQAINNHGQIVVGWDIHFQPYIGGGGIDRYQTYLWQHGRRTLLDMHKVTALNNQGQVVGQISVPTSPRHPALWAHGKTTDLGLLPGGREGIANGINNKGWIVGWIMGEASNKQNGDYRAFLYKDGKMINLGGPPIGEGDYGVNFSQAFAINDKGQVVGTAAFRAVLWENGQKHFLGDLGNQYYENTAYAINNKGQIVGMADSGGYQRSRAFLWQNNKLYDLNDLIPIDSGWVLLDTRGINDKGQIVGSGTYDGKDRAFLLTPLP